MDTDTSSIKERHYQETVTIGCIVSHILEMMTKRKEAMANVTVEDLKGSIEVIFFPDTYKKFYDLIHGSDPIIIKGTVEQGGETTKIICEEVQAIAPTN